MDVRYGPVGVSPSGQAEDRSAEQVFPTLGWLRGAVPVVAGEDAGGYPGVLGKAGVPAVFLYAAGGSIHTASVSWDPVGLDLPGVYDPRHVHLAIASAKQTSSSSLSSANKKTATDGAVGIVVMWATWNETTTSAVEYGAVGGENSTSVVEGSSYSFSMAAKPDESGSLYQYEHVVTLPGLDAGVVYRYRAGSGENGSSFAGSATWHQFSAPQPAGGGKPTAFFALADMGADEADGGQTTAAIEAEARSQAIPTTT